MAIDLVSLIKQFLTPDMVQKLVGSLLGSNTQTALSSAIATFSGLGQGAVTALLGAIAPVVLGIIGKQGGPQVFNAQSLSALLGGQKTNIAGALPPRLGGLLEGSGVLDGLDDVAGAAKAAGASAKQYAGAAAANAAQATARNGRSWAMWAIPLALVVLGLWYFVGRQSPDATPTQQFTNKAAAPVTTTPPLLIGNVDVAPTLTDSLGTLKTSLESVSDAASAQTALPQLQNVTAEIDKVGAVIGNATTEQKAAVKGLITPIVAQLTPVIDRVLAIPGVEALKPTIDGIKAKLANLAV